MFNATILKSWVQNYDFFLNLQHFTRNYFVKHELCCMAVAENFGENSGRVILEVLPSVHDAASVGIGEDGVASLNDFHPFGLWPEDDTRLLEEIGLLLHTARVGDYQLGVTLKGDDLQEGNGWN